MIVKVKLGDVFYINWFRRTSSIYKLYRINYDIRQAYGVCIEDYKITRKAAFIVKHIDNDEIHLYLGDNFEGEFKLLPKLQAILYEHVLDEYWSKYESSSK